MVVAVVARCRARAPGSEGGPLLPVRSQLSPRSGVLSLSTKDRHACSLTFTNIFRPLFFSRSCASRSPHPSTFSFSATWPRGALRSTMPGRPQPASETRPVQGSPGGPWWMATSTRTSPHSRPSRHRPAPHQSPHLQRPLHRLSPASLDLYTYQPKDWATSASKDRVSSDTLNMVIGPITPPLVSTNRTPSRRTTTCRTGTGSQGFSGVRRRRTTSTRRRWHQVRRRTRLCRRAISSARIGAITRLTPRGTMWKHHICQARSGGWPWLSLPQGSATTRILWGTTHRTNPCRPPRTHLQVRLSLFIPFLKKKEKKVLCTL